MSILALRFGFTGSEARKNDGNPAPSPARKRGPEEGDKTEVGPEKELPLRLLPLPALGGKRGGVKVPFPLLSILSLTRGLEAKKRPFPGLSSGLLGLLVKLWW